MLIAVDVPASGMYFGSYEWLLRTLTPPDKRLAVIKMFHIMIVFFFHSLMYSTVTFLLTIRVLIY